MSLDTLSSAMRPLDELTTRCIRCGFCLEACPTFVITGSELESPRGRIYLARSLDEGVLTEEEIRPHIDRCLGCRACETACPSGVEYGEILELTRQRLGNSVPKRALLAIATSPEAMRAQALAGGLLPGMKIPGFVSRLLGAQGSEVRLPQRQKVELPPMQEEGLPPVRGEVYFLEGCAMRALHPRVHACAKRLLRRLGFSIGSAPKAGCCGSMHAHAGELAEATDRARRLAEAMSDDLPVIVNSAGCGSTMKGYAELDPGLASFAGRVSDLSEFLIQNGALDLLSSCGSNRVRATYHDACHLVHGQGISRAPRELIGAVPGAQLIELAEADMCCGSAGIYNVLQPKIARELVERKVDRIEETGAEVVVLGNPGCHAWIEQALGEHGGRVETLHLAEFLEFALLERWTEDREKTGPRSGLL